MINNNADPERTAHVTSGRAPRMEGYNVKSDPELRSDDPRAIDWARRQSHSVVWFTVYDGLPFHPRPHANLLPGRGGLKHWGEAVCSDAIVFATHPETGVRHLLLIERGDGHGWALPGGGLDAGEVSYEGCVRELAEETGLALDIEDVSRMLPPRVVDDPRAGQHAWMVTFPGVIHLPTGPFPTGPFPTGPFPTVTGQDDATDAVWVPAESFDALDDYLHEIGSGIFAAHVDLLREVLDAAHTK